ncbi:MAG TPA: flagellar biosynthetic protein FliR [Polyangiaceae bacterium]
MKDAGLLETLAQWLEAGGIDLAAWALAWARVAPLVAIVPAFGLRALSAPLRAAAALLFALLLIPAVRPLAVGPTPFPVLLLIELLRGTVVALGAAIPLWAATMAGGVVDALRGAQDPAMMPTVEDRATPLAVLFSLLSATLFLATGGPARVVAVLATAPPAIENGLARAAHDLATGIGIAVAIAAPLLAASIMIEVAGALMARAASPAHLHAFLAPVRSLALLVLTAVLFERIASFIALLVRG